MPIATPERYREMLDSARSGGYALPAINTTSSSTILAALEGFAQAGISDPTRYFDEGRGASEP